MAGKNVLIIAYWHVFITQLCLNKARSKVWTKNKRLKRTVRTVLESVWHLLAGLCWQTDGIFLTVLGKHIRSIKKVYTMCMKNILQQQLFMLRSLYALHFSSSSLKREPRARRDEYILHAMWQLMEIKQAQTLEPWMLSVLFFFSPRTTNYIINRIKTTLHFRKGQTTSIASNAICLLVCVSLCNVVMGDG